MEELKMLIEYMWEELGDSMKYAKKALQCKDRNKAASEMFSQLSREEYTHFERLHDQAIKHINNMRDADGNVPADVHTVWSWEHDKLLDRAANVKNVQAMSR